MKLYAIGDIHGCFAELKALLAKIEEDRAGEAAKIVFVGDYVDRGPESAQVIEHLRKLKQESSIVEHVFLRGNHEDMFMDMLGLGGDNGGAFFYNGGAQTMKSYNDIGEDPLNHSDFLRHLQWYHRHGDIVFAHAGLHPEIELSKQTNYSLIWDREFNTYDGDFHDGVFLVHGHTPVPNISRLKNQINIDTGCVFGTDGEEDYGWLTALRIDSDNDWKNDGSLKFKYLQVRRIF